MTALTEGRNSRGNYTRDPETMARDAKAAELHAKRWTYQQIGDELGMTRQAAHQAVKRAMRDIVEAGREGTEAAVELELAKLDALEAGYLEIAQKRHAHLTVSGAIQTFEDDSIILKAFDGLVKVSESRRRLLGLNAPAKLAVEAVVYDGSSIEGRVAELRAILESHSGEPGALDGPVSPNGATAH